jgi:hypothetical protein
MSRLILDIVYTTFLIIINLFQYGNKNFSFLLKNLAFPKNFRFNHEKEAELKAKCQPLSSFSGVLLLLTHQ